MDYYATNLTTPSPTSCMWSNLFAKSVCVLRRIMVAEFLLLKILLIQSELTYYAGYAVRVIHDLQIQDLPVWPVL